jgi:hypothetical protein
MFISMENLPLQDQSILLQELEGYQHQAHRLQNNFLCCPTISSFLDYKQMRLFAKNITWPLTATPVVKAADNV